MPLLPLGNAGRLPTRMNSRPARSLARVDLHEAGGIGTASAEQLDVDDS
ncbi:MAG: hypothetical protein ABIP53_02850 [Candidatus Limnocylindrales bacterium]